MRWLADVVYVLVGLAYAPIAVYQAVFFGKNRRGWGERFGRVAVRAPGTPRIWLHAVSLGEINATPRLVAALRARCPAFDIVLSTTTDTGYARAVQLYGAERVFRFPLDLSPVVSSVLRRVRPTMIVLVELEVWPNLVRMATRRGIPVVVVNGRLTRHSARRLGMLGGAVRSMFGDLAWVGAQDETIAARFRRLGAREDRVTVTSSLKWDSADVADRVDGDAALAGALGIAGDRPVWVCGSTGPGEEAMILRAYRTLLTQWSDASDAVGATGRSGEHRDASSHAPLLVIVPRKPERFDDVARLIDRAGFACVRRSDHPDDMPATPAPAQPVSCVILGDTMGELRKFYALARVVLIGRSLVPMGGSDPMEAAALGKPVVVGPHMDNFEVAVELLRDADAIRVVEDASALAGVIGALLRDAAAATAMGGRGRRVVREQQGATARTVAGLVGVLRARGVGGVDAVHDAGRAACCGASERARAATTARPTV